MQRSDFLMTFYAAGHMVLTGQTANLYPAAGATSLLATSFNTIAHQLLPQLPADLVAVYMYSPLLACLFVPYALLTPQLALIAWQITSIAALAVCANLMAKACNARASKLLWLCLCCFPIYQTLFIGHLGIVLGLLPMCLGYFFLARKKPLLAGFMWSLLLLKPQFLPAVLLVAGVLALCGHFRCVIGLAAGSGLLVLLTFVCLPPGLLGQWIQSLKLSDTIFSNPHYGYSAYLVASLPAVILHLFPMSMRDAVKIPSYALSALIGLHALWLGRKLFKSYQLVALPNIMLLGVMVLPMVLPHFLFYDLCIVAVPIMMVFADMWTQKGQAELRRWMIMVISAIDGYFVLFMSVDRQYVQPASLVAILAALYVLLLKFSFSKPSLVSSSANEEIGTLS